MPSSNCVPNWPRMSYALKQVIADIKEPSFDIWFGVGLVLDYFKLLTNSPAVDESTPLTSPCPRIHPSVSTASFLPISTPHWSKGLISQITDCTKTLCSYMAISAPRL